MVRYGDGNGITLDPVDVPLPAARGRSCAWSADMLSEALAAEPRVPSFAGDFKGQKKHSTSSVTLLGVYLVLQ